MQTFTFVVPYQINVSPQVMDEVMKHFSKNDRVGAIRVLREHYELTLVQANELTKMLFDKKSEMIYTVAECLVPRR